METVCRIKHRKREIDQSNYIVRTGETPQRLSSSLSETYSGYHLVQTGSPLAWFSTVPTELAYSSKSAGSDFLDIYTMSDGRIPKVFHYGELVTGKSAR